MESFTELYDRWCNRDNDIYEKYSIKNPISEKGIDSLNYYSGQAGLNLFLKDQQGKLQMLKNHSNNKAVDNMLLAGPQDIPFFSLYQGGFVSNGWNLLFNYKKIYGSRYYATVKQALSAFALKTQLHTKRLQFKTNNPPPKNNTAVKPNSTNHIKPPINPLPKDGHALPLLNMLAFRLEDFFIYLEFLAWLKSSFDPVSARQIKEEVKTYLYYHISEKLYLPISFTYLFELLIEMAFLTPYTGVLKRDLLDRHSLQKYKAVLKSRDKVETVILYGEGSFATQSERVIIAAVYLFEKIIEFLKSMDQDDFDFVKQESQSSSVNPTAKNQNLPPAAPDPFNDLEAEMGKTKKLTGNSAFDLPKNLGVEAQEIALMTDLGYHAPLIIDSIMPDKNTAEKRKLENTALLKRELFKPQNMRMDIKEDYEYRSGEVDEALLHEFMHNDFIFMQWMDKVKIKTNGTVIGILLDHSGSMGVQRNQLALRLGYILACKFKKTRNKLLVHGYNDLGGCHLYEYYHHQKAKFSFERALGAFKYNIYGTAAQKDAQAIMAQAQMMKKMMDGSSQAYQFIISDTGWCPSSLKYTGNPLKEVKEQIEKNDKQLNIKSIVVGIDLKENIGKYPYFIPISKDKNGTYETGLHQLITEIAALVNGNNLCQTLKMKA